MASATPPRRSARVVPRARGARARSAGASATCSPSRSAAAPGAPQWGFYEGPPTANGPPGLAPRARARVQGHLPPLQDDARASTSSARAAGTATGCRSSSRSRRELGITSKDDIERYGIAEFNARCRETVLSHVEDWNRLTERIGFWIDLDDAYRTLDTDYIESVWWALKTIHDKGLLYEKLKVVPYCPRDGTTLSSHELGQPDVYRDVIDPIVYVRFPVIEDHGTAPRQGDELLVWTTTPWTLVSNAAVAVDPELTYVRARTERRTCSSSPRRWSSACSARGAEVLERFPGRELDGVRYEPPFDFIPGSAYGPHGHTVLIGDFVTAQRRHRPRPHGDRVRRGRLPPRRAVRPERRQPGPARRHLRRADRPVRRALGQGRRPGPRRGPARARAAAARRDLRALLSPLLALRHAAALLRQAVLVHRHEPDQGPAAGVQRDGQLAPGARQARPLRQVARGQRRLGALPRALLGHAAAGLALRGRAHRGRSARSPSCTSCPGRC